MRPCIGWINLVQPPRIQPATKRSVEHGRPQAQPPLAESRLE